MGKIPLIYILSNGRSGSTILDIMLGSFLNTWTLGEAQLLPLELDVDGVCGTGEKIKDSVFWKELVNKLKLKDDSTCISYFRRKNQNGAPSGAVLRKNLIELCTRDKKHELIESYGKLNYDFFQSVIRHAESNQFTEKIHWIIDASKDPYRLMWLKKSGYFDIKVIHLTKTPTAFVYSTSKTKYGRVRSYMVFRMTLRWIVENAIMRIVCKKFFCKEDVYRLKYENLAKDPVKTLDLIGKQFGINLSNYSQNRFREYSNYGISGNKSRWENTNIYLDEKWKTNFPAHYRFLVTLLTRPFIKLHGF